MSVLLFNFGWLSFPLAETRTGHRTWQCLRLSWCWASGWSVRDQAFLKTQARRAYLVWDIFVFLRCYSLLSDSFLSEKDVNADTLWVWCFPAVSAELRELLMRKCCLSRDSPELHAYVFGQYRRSWYYLTTTDVQEPTALTKVYSSL